MLRVKMCFCRSNSLNIHAIHRQQSAQASCANVRLEYLYKLRSFGMCWQAVVDQGITVCRLAIFISTMRWMWPSLLLLNGARSRCVHAFTACTMCGTNCFTSSNFVREFPSVHFQRRATVTVAVSDNTWKCDAGHEEKENEGKKTPLKVV